MDVNSYHIRSEIVSIRYMFCIFKEFKDELSEKRYKISKSGDVKKSIVIKKSKNPKYIIELHI